MAQADGDFLAGEELDDLFLLLDGGFLEDDTNFNVEMDVAVSEVSAVCTSKESFKCEQCEKVCKSKRGLARHIKLKHVVIVDTSGASDVSKLSEIDERSLKKFPLAKLNFIIKNCADNVSKDLCLPLTTRSIFQNFVMSPEELHVLWEKLRPLIDAYSGDAEKFYAEFFGLLSENMLPTKFDDIITTTNILMTEVANHILRYLSNENSDTTSSLKPVTSITDKELKCLQYISGYILHKLYNKFRFNKNYLSEFNTQCVTILKACKSDSDDTQTLVNVQDRGGLWKVNYSMQQLFLKCECIFRSHTSEFSVKIVCEDLVYLMLQNNVVISNFKNICYDIDSEVNKEISLNLLEQILTLFVRLRTFSFAKDVRENQKASKKTAKKRSLRPEIKQASCSTEGGR